MTRGLLEDDHEWRICLEEAIAMQPRMACHQLLAIILQLMKWLSLIFSEINSRLDYVMMSSTNYII